VTLLEKAMQEHAGLNERKIVTWMCPCDFGYEKMEDGCNAAAGDDEKKTCWECWNRETPSTAEAVSEAGNVAPRVSILPQSPQAAGDGKKEGGAGHGG